MWRILLVFAGGGTGAVARWGLSTLVQRVLATSWPLGTLAVNVLGCLAAGALTAWFETRSHASGDTRLLLAVGVLGGFTTFSAFGVDTLALARDGRTGAALLNAAAHLLLALGATALGWCGARALLS